MGLSLKMYILEYDDIKFLAEVETENDQIDSKKSASALEGKITKLAIFSFNKNLNI